MDWFTITICLAALVLIVLQEITIRQYKRLTDEQNKLLVRAEKYLRIVA